MARKDRIYLDITDTVRKRLSEWYDERQGLSRASARIAELTEMIEEAEKELAVAETKVPMEDKLEQVIPQ
jgi:hypothetical protein